MKPFNPKEYKVMALRECPTPEAMALCDTPEKAVDYWRLHVQTSDHFRPECECMVVLLLNTRKRVKGHELLATGTRDTLLVDVSQVFRSAVVAGASALILMHNHPSGEPQPSEADIRVTRDIIRAGQLLNPSFCSLRQLGWFSS